MLSFSLPRPLVDTSRGGGGLKGEVSMGGGNATHPSRTNGEASERLLGVKRDSILRSKRDEPRMTNHHFPPPHMHRGTLSSPRRHFPPLPLPHHLPPTAFPLPSSEHKPFIRPVSPF